MRQARLGLGGDKLDAPTDQHDKRYGCSGGPPQKTTPSRSTRAVSTAMASEGTIVAGFPFI